LKKEILKFFKTNITTKTNYLENQMVDKQFICSLEFLTDISQYLNKLNLQLQGKKTNKQTSNYWVFRGRFRKKLIVFKNLIVENKLTHFLCCEIIKIELDEEFNSEYCITHLDELIVEFKKF